MMSAHRVPGRREWVAVSFGLVERFLTVAEVAELRDVLDAAIQDEPQTPDTTTPTPEAT